jgi:hypothetical protein
MDTNRIPKQALQFKSGFNAYRGWTQTGYLNKHYNIKVATTHTEDGHKQDT